MRIQDIYDDCLTVIGRNGGKRLEQRIFFVYLNQAINDLYLQYPNRFTINGAVQERVDEITDTLVVNELFYDAIVALILYKSGLGDAYLSEAYREAELADDTIRKNDGKNKRIKKWRW